LQASNNRFCGTGGEGRHQQSADGALSNVMAVSSSFAIWFRQPILFVWMRRRNLPTRAAAMPKTSSSPSLVAHALTIALQINKLPLALP